LRTKDELNSKLNAVTDQDGRPVALLLTDGQMSDHTGAKTSYPTLPDAYTLNADKSYDSDEFRNALYVKGIEPCIPPSSNRTVPNTNDPKLYR
jgi:transposase